LFLAVRICWKIFNTKTERLLKVNARNRVNILSSGTVRLPGCISPCK
jgi:hypothetical protein